MECIKCDKEAAKVWRPDLDLKGIGMCLSCEKEVMMDLTIAMVSGDWDFFERKYVENKKIPNGNMFPADGS